MRGVPLIDGEEEGQPQKVFGERVADTVFLDDVGQVVLARGGDILPGVVAGQVPLAVIPLEDLAMAKLKAVTVRDFTWNKDPAGGWKAAPCPLGEGMVDWRPFFAALARIRYVGPITIEVRYDAKDELNAFRHDLEFVRKQIAAAYGKAQG